MRIKLFESVVTPCVLYACGTWTMTAENERQLRAARRKMLRWMTCVGRHVDEDWVEYIQRATHRSEDLAAQHGASDWIELQRRRKWKLAGRSAKQTDGRWSTRLLNWQPWFRTTPRRDIGHPRKRWEDDLTKLAGSWTAVATDEGMWKALEPGYVEKLW